MTPVLGRGDAQSQFLPSIPVRSDDPTGYYAGGEVGRMQANLADRLVREGMAWGPVEAQPGERAIRFVSIAGRYLALLTGFAGAVFLILH